MLRVACHVDIFRLNSVKHAHSTAYRKTVAKGCRTSSGLAQSSLNACKRSTTSKLALCRLSLDTEATQPGAGLTASDQAFGTLLGRGCGRRR
eukprot:629705-Pleurochrysis_carterae.AAC.2